MFVARHHFTFSNKFFPDFFSLQKCFPQLSTCSIESESVVTCAWRLALRVPPLKKRPTLHLCRQIPSEHSSNYHLGSPGPTFIWRVCRCTTGGSKTCWNFFFLSRVLCFVLQIRCSERVNQSEKFLLLALGNLRYISGCLFLPLPLFLWRRKLSAAGDDISVQIDSDNATFERK